MSGEQIAADQTTAIPQPLAAGIRRLIGEYEAAGAWRPSARVTRTSPRLLLQALDYRQQGHGSEVMEPFIRGAAVALRTASGRRLGEAALRTSPAAW